MNNKVKAILFYFFIMLVMPFPIKVLLDFLEEQGIIHHISESTQSLYLNMIIYILMPVVIFLIMRKDLAQELKKSGKYLVRVIPLVLMTYATSILGGILVKIIDHTSSSANQTAIMSMEQQSFGFIIYMTIFAAPFVEETVYRYSIIHNRKGFFGIIMLLLSSALFGLVHVQHFSLGAFLSYTILGLTFGIIYYNNRNLILNIFVHSGYNLLSLILATVLKKYV